MVFVSLTVAEAVDDKAPMRFQVDCGATCNVVPKQLIPNAVISTSHRPPLRAYNKSTIETVGMTKLKVTNVKTKKTQELNCVLVEGNLQPIIGRFAAEEIGLIRFDYEQIDTVGTGENLSTFEEVVKAYPEVFNDRVGRFPGKVKLHLREGAVPSCNVSSRVSPHIKTQLREALRKLEEKEVIRRVEEPTEWVSRLSIQIKKSGELRLCLDPRALNESLIREVFHTPALDELLPELKGARIFSKFDLSDGFWHCELEKESSLLITFQTPFGRYRFKRLPFGLKVAPRDFLQTVGSTSGGPEGHLRSGGRCAHLWKGEHG